MQIAKTQDLKTPCLIVYVIYLKRIIDGFGLIRLFFLIPRTQVFNFWCDACSISAIGESNVKSQLAKYFQNSYALRDMAGRKGRGLKFHEKEK